MDLKFSSISAILLIFIVLFLTLGFVSASDNATDAVLEESEVPVLENDVEIQEDSSIVEESDLSGEKASTQIETDNLEMYYKDNADFVGYFKDVNGTPVANKKITVSVAGKVYNRTTDDNGMFKLPIQLKPKSYNVLVKFNGDDDFESSYADSLIKVKKIPVLIKTKDFNTYVGSDLFFTVTAYNEINKSPMAGVKLLFKVYSKDTKKYSYYYATTDKNGVASLNKNLPIGNYIIYTSAVGNTVSYKTSQGKSSMIVKPTAEMGCCSVYVQVSSSEAVCGFRRDSTYSVNILVISQSWWGKTAIKQYKTIGTYSFHLIVTCDGWMIGTGGADNPTINRNVEKLAGQMVSDGCIQRSKLNQIRNYIARLGIGHFAIKAPNGRYAAVWKNGMEFGVLKPGEFISVPNYKSCYRHGTYARFGSHPASAAIKIAATDSYGVNKRDILVHHWKATTKDYKTSAIVKSYGSNDNGKLSGRSTAHLKDNIYYKNVFHSKNSLPYPIRGKVLGIHNFGNIDKFTKTHTVVVAPKVTNKFNQPALFKVNLKNKAGKPVGYAYIYVKIYSSKFSKTYHLKTDANGLVKIDTKVLGLGNYNVLISQANNRYWTSGTSTISIVK